jgi:hypothetical protein
MGAGRAFTAPNSQQYARYLDGGGERFLSPLMLQRIHEKVPQRGISRNHMVKKI